jgi:UDP-glucose 4-epimerase
LLVTLLFIIILQNLMHYLITGGAGFIGSHLTERLLAQGHRVSVLDDLSTGKKEHIPASVDFIQGDTTTPGIFDKLVANIDGCFHLAAIASVQMSKEQWQRTHQVNLGGIVALFDAIVKNKKNVPVVYASSAAVYGDATTLPHKESATCVPLSGYGVDKLGCEQQARIASEIHHIPTAGMRFFNVYGERQDPNSPYSGVISIFAKRMKENAPITIFGDGKQTRDFIYVGDVVNALQFSMQAFEQKKFTHGVFNICTGKQQSVNALAEILVKLTGSRSNISYAPARSGDIKLSAGDTTLAHTMLGFSAKIPLEEGLKRTLGY